PKVDGKQDFSKRFKSSQLILLLAEDEFDVIVEFLLTFEFKLGNKDCHTLLNEVYEITQDRVTYVANNLMNHIPFRGRLRNEVVKTCSRGVNLKEGDGNDDNDKENVGSDNAVTSSAGVSVNAVQSVSEANYNITAAITTATTSEEQQQQPITSSFVSTKRRIVKRGSRNSTSASVDTIDDSSGNEETNSKKINVHVVKEKQSNMWVPS
ncbi:unnamed protein product, partial [Didymodactylos carnosus]